MSGLRKHTSPSKPADDLWEDFMGEDVADPFSSPGTFSEWEAAKSREEEGRRAEANGGGKGAVTVGNGGGCWCW